MTFSAAPVDPGGDPFEETLAYAALKDVARWLGFKGTDDYLEGMRGAEAGTCEVERRIETMRNRC